MVQASWLGPKVGSRLCAALHSTSETDNSCNGSAMMIVPQILSLVLLLPLLSDCSIRTVAEAIMPHSYHSAAVTMTSQVNFDPM